MATSLSTHPAVASLGTYPTLIEPERPSNPELLKICDDVGNAVRFLLASELAQASRASDPLTTSYRAFIAARKSASRNAAKRRVAALFESPANIREMHFGRYASLSGKDMPLKSIDGLLAGVSRLKLDKQRLAEGLSIGRINDHIMPLSSGSRGKDALLRYKPGAVAAALDRAEGAKFKKLGLFIKTVECIDETDEVGADEIAVGGNKTNPDGSTHLIKQFMIDDDFDTGEKKTFPSNGRKFAEWNLVTNAEFPCVYGAVMVMAEKDDGGFHDFLVKLWKLVGDTLVKEIGKATGAAIGAAIGSAFGGIGAVIGAAIGWLFGAIIGWLIDLFDNPDDIVAVKTFLMGLGAATKSYYEWAKLIGPSTLSKTDFNGDGGRYRVWWQYRVYA